MHRKIQCWIFVEPLNQTSQFDSEIQCLLFLTNENRGAFWQPITGSVEKEESFSEGAIRELKEETGFILHSPPIDTGYEFNFQSRFGPTCERVFVAKLDHRKTPKLDPKEHQSFQWLIPEEALSLLRFPSNIEGLKKSFEQVFGRELEA